ncbi:hypothetical protein R6Q57_001787 [Mikania cordata]
MYLWCYVYFGISELLKVTKKVKQEELLSYHDTTWRYVAPEAFRNEDYDTKVDVFSFALILQEEGYYVVAHFQYHKHPITSIDLYEQLPILDSPLLSRNFVVLGL